MRKHLRKADREDDAKLCGHQVEFRDCPTCNAEKNVLQCPKCNSYDINVQQTFSVEHMRTISWDECEQCNHRWGYN